MRPRIGGTGGPGTWGLRDGLLPGHPLPVRLCGCEPDVEVPRWSEEGPGAPLITEVDPVDGVVWAGREFALRVAFRSDPEDPVVLV